MIMRKRLTTPNGDENNYIITQKHHWFRLMQWEGRSVGVGVVIHDCGGGGVGR